jgi:hypothetical protein
LDAAVPFSYTIVVVVMPEILVVKLENGSAKLVQPQITAWHASYRSFCYGYLAYGF